MQQNIEIEKAACVASKKWEAINASGVALAAVDVEQLLDFQQAMQRLSDAIREYWRAEC